MGAPGSWLLWTLRTVAIAVVLWMLADPIAHSPSVADADLLPTTPPPPASAGLLTGRADPVALAGDRSAAVMRPAPQTDFSVAPGAFAQYFRARGGARTFGPPISNRFVLLGQEIQLFRNHVLRQNADGSIATMPLLDIGAVPSLRAGGRSLPPADQQVAAAAAAPGEPDYAGRAQAFIRANAPDQWEGLPVGFYAAFLATVTFQDAFPDGSGDPALLPGFAQEVWGLPVSRPTRDPGNPDLVYLRWERGVMEYDRRVGGVRVVPLGALFKAVLTGEDLPDDLATEAQGSRFFRQLDPLRLNGVARPFDLPETVLLGAFGPSTTASAAPQSGAGAAGAGSAGAQAPPTPTPTPTPTLTLRGVGPTIVGPTGVTGPDVCHGDERITFAPENPRVGNEVLVAVTSAGPHPYGRLAGTERATFVRERPGQLGTVWEWTLTPTFEGIHEYTFYVDSTIPCKQETLRVGGPLGTPTPTPTRVPRTSSSDGYGNGNGNSNLNVNLNVNSNDNNSSTSSVDLRLTNEDSVDPVRPGQALTYTLVVTNDGTSSADNVTLTDTLPSETTYRSASSTRGSCSQSGATVSCSLGRLGGGTIATVRIDVTVAPTIAPGTTLTNTAVVTSDDRDSLPSNNSASQTTTIQS